MSYNPLISVIIPCYNQGHYLPQALDSVIAQTYINWECIIVNDGSQDDTRTIAFVYKNKIPERIRYVEQHNSGLSSARNRGLAEARGEYIQFLDSDDFILPKKFETQINLLLSCQDPSLAYCSYYYLFENSRKVSSNSKFLSFSHRFTMESPLLDMAIRWETDLSIPAHCFLFSAKFFNNLGVEFDQKLPTHEDWDCWMKILSYSPRVVYTDRKDAVYRLHGDSMCIKDYDKMWYGFSSAINKQKREFHGNYRMQAILTDKMKAVKRLYGQDLNTKIGKCYLAVWRVIQKKYQKTVPWPIQKFIASMMRS